MFGRLAMGFANVRASRYGIRSCSGVSLWNSLMFGRVLEYSHRLAVADLLAVGGVGPEHVAQLSLALCGVEARALVGKGAVKVLIDLLHHRRRVLTARALLKRLDQ